MKEEKEKKRMIITGRKRAIKAGKKRRKK